MVSKLTFLSTCLLLLLAIPAPAQKRSWKESDFERGYYFLYYNQWDSAFVTFQGYTSISTDSLRKGKAYLFLGDVLSNIGDYYLAQENLKAAEHTLNKADEKHRETLSYVYNSLGNISSYLKLYDEAIGFYNKAIPLSAASFLPEPMNGKGIAFQKMGNFSGAIAIYDSLLRIKTVDKMMLARIIDNRAFTKWRANAHAAVLNELHAALKLRIDSQYSIGLNASYAHLSDYHAKLQKDSAVWYAHKMLGTAEKNQNPNDKLEAIDKLILLSNDPATKDQWYVMHKNLKDSLQFARDTTQNRFALVKYDVKEMNSVNLILQQEVSKHKTRNYILIAAALLLTGCIYGWYRIRKKRIQRESEKAIAASKLKTSQKVHDVVANGLYRIMNELEHSNTIEKEPLINKIEGLYEQSRNLSYEEVPAPAAGFHSQVQELLYSFASDARKVFILGNEPALWNRIAAANQQQLLLVFTELMVNMKKHSRAKNVIFHFTQQQFHLHIQYKDDGTGLEAGTGLGNGLNNAVNRIKSLNGIINFGKSEKGGTVISIRLPLQ